MRVVPLRIADLDLRLELPAVLADWAAQRWPSFLGAPAGSPFIVIRRGRIGPPSDATAQRPLPKVTQQEGGEVTVSGEDWSGTRVRTGEPWLIDDEVNEAGLCLMVQLALAGEVARRDGLVLHSVGLKTRQGAAVFLGQSGAGKSTLGSEVAAGGGELLSDELVVVLPEEGGWRAHGTPWNRGTSASGALRTLGLLGWGAHRLEAVTSSDVLKTLLPNALILDVGSAARQDLFRRASSLLAQVPLRRFVFDPEPSAAHALERALESLP